MTQAISCPNQCSPASMIVTSEGSFCMTCGKLAAGSAKNKTLTQKSKLTFGILAKDLDITTPAVKTPATIIKTRPHTSVKVNVAGISGNKSRARLAS